MPVRAPAWRILKSRDGYQAAGGLQRDFYLVVDFKGLQSTASDQKEQTTTLYHSTCFRYATDMPPYDFKISAGSRGETDRQLGGGCWC